MRVLPEGFGAHLASGATTLCRCWKITRHDGTIFGFTDHDRDLAFDGLTFKASTGLDAAALQQTTGLSVDNSQAVGALSDIGLNEHDIGAGAYDGADVLAWLVNWQNPVERLLQFRGTIGEIRRNGGVFEAEIRGLSEALNQPQGQAYHRTCSAVLGGQACGFDLSQAGYRTQAVIKKVETPGHFVFAGLTDFEGRWFEKGVLRVLDGAAQGAMSIVRSDRFNQGLRHIELWQEPGFEVLAGDRVSLEVGCDKRSETCRLKFHNFLNFRGFPHIPGEDWAMSYPTRGGINNGGPLR